MSQKAGRVITRYVRDASGNVMAVYQADTLSERPIYGSSRLGNLSYASKPGYRTVGHKQYELSNHLGNVLAVVSDRIRMKTDSTWTQVLSRTDYYPFGLEMTGRTESNTYRYGFNGKEKDPSGQWSNQSHYDYGFRIYNPTIGKFLSVDPLTKSYPMLTPYQFASNTPIMASDLDGLEGRLEITTSQEELGRLDGTFTDEQIRENQKARATGAVMGIGILVDALITKGWISKSLFALSFGDFSHSSQMQTHYRDMGMPTEADRFKAEGGQAATELAVEGLSYGAIKWASQLVKTVPEIPYLRRLDNADFGGAGRAAQYSSEWGNASLEEAVNRFAPGSKGLNTSTGKTLYLNSETGIQVVADDAGNYFRIENTTLTGRRRYLDLDGQVPNNKVIDGKTSGRSQAEYNQVTHFNNVNKK